MELKRGHCDRISSLTFYDLKLACLFVGLRACWLVKNLPPLQLAADLHSCEISCAPEYCGRNKTNMRKQNKTHVCFWMLKNVFWFSGKTWSSFYHQKSVFSDRWNLYIPREIDLVARERQNHCHYPRPAFQTLFCYDFHHKAIKVQKAIEYLLLKTPETKVIPKTENTRGKKLNVEMFNDYGNIHNLIMRDIFVVLNGGIIDAWDMWLEIGLPCS